MKKSKVSLKNDHLLNDNKITLKIIIRLVIIGIALENLLPVPLFINLQVLQH